MSSDPAISEVSVDSFAQRMAQTDLSLQLLDVREPQELELANISGFQNVPLSQFQLWSASLAKQLDPQVETYVICHHGMRSAQMCQWLIGKGFTNVNNISGGIDAYALIVDPSVPRY
jgi:rhodanese-related sulfurtransferase